MPRIYDSGNDPHDFCRGCYPLTETIAEQQFGRVRLTGEGPDGRGNCFGYDAEHPPYEDENYKCETCKKPLLEKDN
jgi:hypothetical protein